MTHLAQSYLSGQRVRLQSEERVLWLPRTEGNTKMFLVHVHLWVFRCPNIFIILTIPAYTFALPLFRPSIVCCGRKQHFLNLQEFPGYSSVRPCLIRHVSTLVPYECHVFTGAKGRRITVRRKEIAFFSHCWDLPPDQVCSENICFQ